MTYSKGLVVVGDQRALDWLAGVVVVPDGDGQGEDALDDPGQDSGGGVPAVAFGVELALEGVVDRFDDLPQWPEDWAPGRWSSPVRAGRSRQAPAVGQGGLKAGAVVVLVPEDGLAGPR
jgi:hypothetical protein